MDIDVKKLQRHFNNGVKDGFQAKVHYQVNDRVHLRGTKVNGTVLAVVFKEDRNYPYLKIKWDTIPAEPEKCKSFYDPFDVTKEIVLKCKQEKKKKVYENFYLNERRRQQNETN